MTVTIDADNLHYRELNDRIKELWKNGENSLVVNSVSGHRYIGDALYGSGKIAIYGVPGNDMGVFMDGPDIEVHGNIQDAAANTMNRGSIVVHGSAGDTLGYGMRGGQVFVRNDVGYRAGIHMKEYGEQIPVLVIGGAAGDFLGEYMAGGVIIVININEEANPVGAYCGSGMHGGAIYIRRPQTEMKLKGIVQTKPSDTDLPMLDNYLQEYSIYFNRGQEIKADEFIKITAAQLRPYEKLYVGV